MTTIGASDVRVASAWGVGNTLFCHFGAVNSMFLRSKPAGEHSLQLGVARALSLSPFRADKNEHPR